MGESAREVEGGAGVGEGAREVEGGIEGESGMEGRQGLETALRAAKVVLGEGGEWDGDGEIGDCCVDIDRILIVIVTVRVMQRCWGRGVSGVVMVMAI